MQSNTPGGYRGKLATLALNPCRGSSTEAASSPSAPNEQTKTQPKPRVRFSLPPEPRRQTETQSQSHTQTQLNSQPKSSIQPLHLSQNKVHARTWPLHPPASTENIVRTLQPEPDKTIWCNKVIKPTLWTEEEMEKVAEYQGDELVMDIERWLESIYRVGLGLWRKGGVFEKENMSLSELRVVVGAGFGIQSSGKKKDVAVQSKGASGKGNQIVAAGASSSKIDDKIVRHHRELD